MMKELKVEAWELGFEPVMGIVCKHILKQKQRLGGDFAVAFATPTRRQIELIWRLLGLRFYFIVLNMSKECQEKRVQETERTPH